MFLRFFAQILHFSFIQALFWNHCKPKKREPNFEMDIKHQCHSLLGANHKIKKTNTKMELSGWRMHLILIMLATNYVNYKNSFWICKIFKFPNGCGGISTQHALPMLCWIAVSSYSYSNNYYCGNYEMTYDSFWPVRICPLRTRPSCLKMHFKE